MAGSKPINSPDFFRLKVKPGPPKVRYSPRELMFTPTIPFNCQDGCTSVDCAELKQLIHSKRMVNFVFKDLRILVVSMFVEINVDGLNGK